MQNGFSAGSWRAPGTSRSTNRPASKKPALSSGTFHPAGRTVPARTTATRGSSLTPIGDSAFGSASGPRGSILPDQAELESRLAQLVRE